jgi:hypothetical protein
MHINIYVNIMNSFKIPSGKPKKKSTIMSMGAVLFYALGVPIAYKYIYIIKLYAESV